MTTSPVTARPEIESRPETRIFSLREKIALWLISWAGYLAIVFICPTLRYSIVWEESAPSNRRLEQQPIIYSFWHRCVFPAAWLWMNFKIGVMVSRSFDGEYIARIIEKFGFAAIRGSSSRGGAAALLGMKSHLEQGLSVAFTIDGPRGPKYVAKPGPVLLSKISSQPMAPFYVALNDAWILKTWDQFMIPKPFSKALACIGARIPVPPDADDAQMRLFHEELQRGLERVTRFAEENVNQVGSKEFPLLRG